MSLTLVNYDGTPAGPPTTAEIARVHQLLCGCQGNLEVCRGIRAGKRRPAKAR